MHDRQGEPGDNPESVGYDVDDDIISLPEEPCDDSCPASECCNDAELSHPAGNGESQLVAPNEACGEQPERNGDEDRVIVLDKINDSHLTIRYFDEEKDGRLEKQYRCVSLTLIVDILAMLVLTLPKCRHL